MLLKFIETDLYKTYQIHKEKREDLVNELRNCDNHDKIGAYSYLLEYIYLRNKILENFDSISLINKDDKDIAIDECIGI